MVTSCLDSTSWLSNMDKDKEAVALFQNKRQEIRCNQVINAVNKEQNLRERELMHEAHHFKTKLWKLVQKRKELRLDPIMTKELELFLNSDLRKKVAKSPNKRDRKQTAKSNAADSSKLVACNNDASEDVFVTKMFKNSGKELHELNGTKNVSRYPILPVAKPTKQLPAVMSNKEGVDKEYKNPDKLPTKITGTSGLTSVQQERKTSKIKLPSIRQRFPSLASLPGLQTAHVASEEERNRFDTQANDGKGGMNNHFCKTKAHFLKRSMTEMNLSINNNKQWINVLNGQSNLDETEDFEQRRHQSRFTTL